MKFVIWGLEFPRCTVILAFQGINILTLQMIILKATKNIKVSLAVTETKTFHIIITKMDT